MITLEETNIEEKRLVEQITGLETSKISNSIEDVQSFSIDSDYYGHNDYSNRWYRHIHKALWLLQGLDFNTQMEVLSRIACSKNKRTREFVDTVETYGDGNWVFEFMHKGKDILNQIKDISVTDENREKISTEILRANKCFSVASYPHLYSDKKAELAQIQAANCYRKLLEVNNIEYKELSTEVEYNGSKSIIRSWLHLPRTDQPNPLIIVIGSFENIFSDYFKLYVDCLQKLGCAMLVLDNARTGQNKSFVLDHDCSFLHRNVLDSIIENEPLIDSNNIGLLGFRFGGNIATRMSFMRAKNIKFSILVGPVIDSFFVNPKYFNQCTTMQRAIFCNKIDKDARNWDLLQPYFSQYSLKVQGLLGRITKVPFSIIGIKNDFWCSEEDLNLLKKSSSNAELVILGKDKKNQISVANFFQEINNSIKKFLNKK